MRGTGARRAGTLGAILLLCVAGLGVRLGYVQGVRAESYAEEARQQRVRQIDLPARRGTIYDRLGGELATSVPARTIYADPRSVSDPAETARRLAEVLQLPAEQLESRLRKDRTFVYLARRIGVVTAEQVEALRLPGIGVLEEPRRVYPAEQLAANVVGFIGTDQQGLAGVEFGYDKLLGGKPGHRVHEQDPRGRRIPQGIFVEEPPVAGSDIVLTIHPDVQLAAERALQSGVERTRAEGGMVVAIDPRSGEILAMASSPTYDPNAIGEIDELTTRNRVVTEAFEPGSVNKIVTAAAALTEGVVTPEERIEVPSIIRIADHEFIEEAGARPRDLRGILTESSNLGTIRIAQRLGADTLRDYFSRVGYGRGTGLGFPGESAGNIPQRQWATDLPTMAIGQSLTVTQLQLAQVYAMIANSGVSVEPKLVKGWVDPRGELHRPSESRGRRVLEAGVADTLRDMLRSVVSEGTGRLAAIEGYEVAGKTGTARRAVEGVGYRGHTASFVGMFPASSPRIVIAVVLDNPVPIEGGLAAAPVFADVGSQAARILRIPAVLGTEG